MNVLIVDFFNLIKRYTFLIDSAEELDGGEFYSDVATKIVNKIVKTCDEYKIDFAIICSDLGFNRRANSVLSGEYKANRVRAKSATQEEKLNIINNLRPAYPTLAQAFQNIMSE